MLTVQTFTCHVVPVQVTEHPWLSIAQPQLPPLVVNDRLAQVLPELVVKHTSCGLMVSLV